MGRSRFTNHEHKFAKAFHITAQSAPDRSRSICKDGSNLETVQVAKVREAAGPRFVFSLRADARKRTLWPVRGAGRYAETPP